jgi:hypothetical protein
MNTTTTTVVIDRADLPDAYQGWYYTIIGCGGDLQEWVKGYNGLLQDAGIGTPSRWLQTTGAEVNAFAGTIGAVNDPFKNNLTLLMFPLEGLHGGRLAMFKLQHMDRWFNDVVDNMTEREEDGE